MRLILPILLLSAFVLSGCADDKPAAAPDPLPVGATGFLRADDFSDAQDVTFASESPTDPVPVPVPVPLPFLFAECNGPVSSCFQYDFDVTMEGAPGNVTGLIVMAMIMWGNQDNDFDIAIFDANGNEVISDYDPAPEQAAMLMTPIKEGSYTLQIISYQVIDDHFDLTVMFIPEGEGIMDMVAVAIPPPA